MSNIALQNHLPDSVPLSKRLALLQANSVFSDFEIQPNTKKTGRTGNQLALYTWGTLATLSMVFAAGLLVTEIKIQETRQIAKLEAKQHKIAALVQIQKKKDGIRAELPTPQKSTLSLAESLVPAEKIDKTTTASIGKGQDRVDSAQVVGFGVSLGASSAPDSLSSRYLALSNRAPELFMGLKPKVQFSSSDHEKKLAKLVVGPFQSEKELHRFCKDVRSRMAMACSQEDYAGKKLLLPPLL